MAPVCLGGGLEAGRGQRIVGERIGTKAFDNCSIEVEGPLDRVLFDKFVAALGPNVLRGKGFLRFASAPEKVVLYQRVGTRWSLTSQEGPELPAMSRLVLIGKNGALDGPALKAELRRCSVGGVLSG